MHFDFDKIIDRSGTYSEKWNIKEGELPMWVADMDFETAPEIKQAILERAEHGVFGYSYVPDEWYEAIIKWWDRRYDYKMDRDSLHFCTGVVPAISASIQMGGFRVFAYPEGARYVFPAFLGIELGLAAGAPAAAQDIRAEGDSQRPRNLAGQHLRLVVPSPPFPHPVERDRDDGIYVGPMGLCGHVAG